MTRTARADLGIPEVEIPTRLHRLVGTHSSSVGPAHGRLHIGLHERRRGATLRAIMAFVLVTGSAGAIGRPVCEELLRRGHQVRGLDRVSTPGLVESVVVDLVDRAGVRAAVRGVDTVVHLAAHPDDADFSVLEGPNVRGLFHVLEAARLEGVRRVILASSIQALGAWWDQSRSVPAGTRDGSPTNHYALTKVWAEHMGEMYARCHGLSVMAVRVAFMVRNPAEALQLVQRKVHDMYLSRADVGRFFALGVEAPPIDFAVLYAVGAGGERWFDMEPARRLLGFEARDAWPDGLGFAVPFEGAGSAKPGQ